MYLPTHFGIYNNRYWEDKTNALHCFLDDYGRKNGHYVHGELPVLPFPDQVFDLVLSSHFLFVYASKNEGILLVLHIYLAVYIAYFCMSLGGVMDTNTYNYDFHAKAITELARVRSYVITHTCTLLTHSFILRGRYVNQNY